MKLLLVSLGILLVAFLYYATRFVRATVHFQRRHDGNSEAAKTQLEAFATLPSRETDAESSPDRAAEPNRGPESGDGF